MKQDQKIERLLEQFAEIALELGANPLSHPNQARYEKLHTQLQHILQQQQKTIEKLEANIVVLRELLVKRKASVKPVPLKLRFK